MASRQAKAADAAWRRDPQWIAPVLWRSEFRNALAGAVRLGSLTIDSAIEIAAVAEAMLAGNEFMVSAPAVMRLVASCNCSAYDCEFVALAKERRVPLLTADQQILRYFPEVAIPLEKFAQK
jgi:predicted nucleic acid-binding protein